MQSHAFASAGAHVPVCLIIMDGFGLDAPGPGNAISCARTPHLDALFSTGCASLRASGEAVGLPEGQMGNSEVGHLNIGAGRVVDQELTRINKACRMGMIAKNPVLAWAFSRVREEHHVLHLMGLVSDGGVHSSDEHLFALMAAAAQAGVDQVYVHCFLDGRDVPPKSALRYIENLEERIAHLAEEHPTCQMRIASVSGRYYAMDRDQRWDRVEKAYEALVEAMPMTNLSAADAIKASYEEGITDEFFVPLAFQTRGIQEGDAVIFFNFRPDRARQITRAFVDEDFAGFVRASNPKVDFICLTEYDPTLPAPIAFPKTFPEQVLADVLADAGLSQYHIAETEKYAHVTFFLNGGVEEPKPGEMRKLIASPKVATYDLQPQMSEPDVADALSQAIRAHEADVYIVNFANCDMVGHTGSIPAAIEAVEAVDAGVGQVLAALEEVHGTALITADHGNADQMLSQDGSPHTAHTTAPVPFAVADFSDRGVHLVRQEGALCDIAPSVLSILQIPQPEQMTGQSLVATSV